MDRRRRVLMLGPGLDVKGGVSSVERLIVANLSDRVEMKMVATMQDGPHVKKALVFGAATLKVLLLLVRGWPDVVQVQFTTGASMIRKMFFARLCMLFRKKVILHGHAATFHLYIPSRRPIYKRWIMNTIHASNCLICISERWRHFFADLGVDTRRIVVMANPVRLPDAIPERPGAQIVRFLFTGEIGKRKGAFDIISALKQLPKEVQCRVRVLMVGNGQISEAQLAIREAGLQEVVEIRDWVDPQTRDRLLAESDALLLPSYNEGLPMSMLEAMSFGLPVITTPVGGIPEYVRHEESGLLIEPGEVGALAEEIRRLAADEGLRRKLGVAAYEAVKPLNIADYCARLEELYESIVRTGAPPPS